MGTAYEKAIVVTLATTHTSTMQVECDPWHQNELYLCGINRLLGSCRRLKDFVALAGDERLGLIGVEVDVVTLHTGYKKPLFALVLL